MSLAVIIVAAGSSSRAGFDKLAAQLGNKSVLEHSVAAFLQQPGLEHIVVVCDRQRFDSQLGALQAECARRSIRLSHCDGGSQRHFSVYNGLRQLDTCSLVAIHDGARPLIHPGQIAQCFQQAAQYAAVASAHQVVDTLKRADEQGMVCGEVAREQLWAMETPQVFAYAKIMQAYEHVLANDLLVTDEVSACQAAAIPVKLVANNTPNPKITYAADLQLAERLLGSQASPSAQAVPAAHCTRQAEPQA